MTTLIANHISATRQGCAARGEAEEPKRESLRLSAQLDALEWILMSHGEDGTRPNELSSTRSPYGGDAELFGELFRRSGAGRGARAPPGPTRLPTGSPSRLLVRAGVPNHLNLPSPPQEDDLSCQTG
jgi:hypothetical protein